MWERKVEIAQVSHQFLFSFFFLNCCSREIIRIKFTQTAEMTT